MRKRAFTLVEVLVAIAVVAILAGLIYAAAGPGKALARRTACMSHAKDIATAALMYHEHEGIYPGAGDYEASIGHHAPHGPESYVENWSRWLEGRRSLVSVLYHSAGGFVPEETRAKVFDEDSIALTYCDEHEGGYIAAYVSGEVRWAKEEPPTRPKETEEEEGINGSYD